MTKPPKDNQRMFWKRHSHQGRRGFRHSLMPKLIVILIATGCLVDFTVGGFHRILFSPQARAALEKNVEHYASFLAGEIGSPPDTVKAKAIAQAYALHIRYQGPSGIWDSRPDAVFKLSSGHRRWGQGKFCVLVPLGQGEFQFVPDFRQMMESHTIYLALMILILSLVLAGAFFAIRQLLCPLKDLTLAVESLGKGELGHQVPICSQDEFGDLARSFNTMSRRLADLVKAREQLLLDVSHELRSPLTRIKVALEMAPKGISSDSIREDLWEMETMVGEILEAARLDSTHGGLNREDVDLAELVSEAIQDAMIRIPGALFHKMGKRSSEKDPSTDGEGPHLKVDRARIRKVLANVLDNAIKFSQGNNIPIEVNLEENSSEIVVRVQDRGVGIPAKELANIFEPFYRIDRSRSRDTGGYGLGLSLCKRIMEAHGASLKIQSEMGKGTEVSLVFPKL